MEREVDRRNGLAGRAPKSIEPIETVHRFNRGIDSQGTGLISRPRKERLRAYRRRGISGRVTASTESDNLREIIGSPRGGALFEALYSSALSLSRELVLV